MCVGWTISLMRNDEIPLSSKYLKDY